MDFKVQESARRLLCVPAKMMEVTVPLVLKWWGDKLERKSSGGGEGKYWGSAPQP